MMESIVKLRKYVYDVLTKSAAYAINDMIDEVERDVAELTDERDLLKTQWEAGVDFDQRLESCAENREDVTLWGVDYTPVPVDADGVPIHVGDVMDEGKVAKVVLTDEHWEPSVYVYKLPNVQHEYFCSEVTHHHAPTVEDVLREFAQEMNENLGMYTGEAIDADEWRKADERTIAEYAAKLRLAGDE